MTGRLISLSLTLLTLLLLAVSLQAQDTDDVDDTVLRYNEDVDGRLDNLTPSARYTFEGLRGEFVSLTLTTQDGNLDPMLTVLGARGEVLALLDDGSGRGAQIGSLRIPQNGTYTVVVSRFGGTLGTTAGGYTLRLERVGISSQSGSALRYDDTIINTISDGEPALYYTFQAARGDILDIRMQRVSGDLDPVLQVVDATSSVIASSDDIPGSSTLDAAVEGLVIEADGVYVIVATRYGEGSGNSTGAFVLSIQESEDSGLGNTLQTAADLPPGRALEGELTPNRFEQFYTFFANENDLVRVKMDRVSGSLDAYLVILDGNFLELAFDDDGGGGQNAQIRELRIPATGVYYIKATRYGGTEGNTVGRYSVELEVLGGAFDEVQADALPILYNSTVTGVISDEQPEVIYAFYGTQGDAITVAMSRGDGNLDPVVSILGEDLQPLVTDDDSGGGQNARLERYVLSRTGVYYIRAGRYSGADGDTTTRGGYILVFAQVTTP